jgi:hypothetical protein
MKKLASTGFLIGALLVAIGSLLVPRADDLSNVLEMQQAFGENVVLLQTSALLITFGFWAVMAGMIGFYHFIIIDSNSPWMLLAFYFHIAGVVLWSVGMSLDISYPAAIANWLAAPAVDKDLAYTVVTVLSPLGFGRGLFPLNVLINWLAFTFLGMGMIQNALFPRWLGLVGLVVGLLGLALGIAMTFTGREALVNLFVILMLLTIVWWLAIAVWLARKAM